MIPASFAVLSSHASELCFPLGGLFHRKGGEVTPEERLDLSLVLNTPVGRGHPEGNFSAECHQAGLCGAVKYT